jgi:hypothetical protein
MQTLLTASAILIQTLLLVAGWYVAERARNDVVRLRRAREQIGELELGLESVRKQLASLRGKFYATRAEQPAEVYPQLPLAPSGSVCENWLAAQNPNAPNWRQARECECRYCLEQRHARARARAAAVPKTAQGQGELARLNSGQANE